jgi:hypothetical protein
LSDRQTQQYGSATKEALDMCVSAVEKPLEMLATFALSSPFSNKNSPESPTLIKIELDTWNVQSLRFFFQSFYVLIPSSTLCKALPEKQD